MRVVHHSGRNVNGYPVVILLNHMLQQVVRNTSYFLISSVGQKILAFLYFTLLARTLGPEATGQYMLALSFAALFAVVVDCGLSPVLTRTGAQDQSVVGRILRRIIGFKLLLACAVVPLVVMAGFIAGYAYSMLVLIATASLVMVGDSIHLTLYAGLRSLQKFQYEAQGVVAAKIVVLLVGIPFILLKLPLPYLMLPLAASTLLNIGYACFVLRRVSPTGSHPALQGETLLRQPVSSLILFLRQGIPFTAASLFTTLWISADSVLLSILHDASAVGLWSVPMKLAFALQFIPSALSVSLYPAIAREHKDITNGQSPTNGTNISQAFQASIRYLWLLAFPVSVGTILLAPQIITTVYGASYASAIPALQIAIAFLPFYFVNLQLGSLLAGTNQQPFHAKLIGLAATTSVVINIVFIPTYGILSAATAMLVSSIVFFMGGIFATRHLVAISWVAYGKLLLHIACACALMGLVVFGVQDLTPLLVTVFAGAATYAGALFIVREVSIDEVKRLYVTFTSHHA